MLVEYIGSNAWGHADTVAGTGVRWTGPNDVQEVPDLLWPKFAKHPDVWRAVEESADDLDSKTLDELRALCTANGIEFHPNAKEASLVAKLRSANA